jgi:hypothetical protein
MVGHYSANQSVAMTLPHLIERRATPRPEFRLISSTATEREWVHPVLPYFPLPEEIPQQQAKLFLIPSTFDDQLESDELPQPTSSADLPDIVQWSSRFIISLLEVWGGRRQPAQLIGRCHRAIYFQLLKKVGIFNTLPKLRNIHIQESFDGLYEITVTVRVQDRLRALAMRIEGVDQRWLCTALDIL